MRKIIRIFLSFALVFVFTSCGNEVAEADSQFETVVETEEEKTVEQTKTTEVQADEPVEYVEKEETITVYAGSINQKYLIHMTIVQTGSDVIGSYYYDSRKIDIPFNGQINNNDFFITTDDGSETFDGKFTGTEISGIWTMGETVYDFELTEEAKVDTDTYDEASIREETIIEFNLVETGERVGIYVDSNSEYIVFRLGKDGNVLVEGPSFDTQSWENFEYYTYHRGGGVENEGIDTVDLYFTVGLVKYHIYQEYSATNGKISYGFDVTEEGNSEVLEYTCDETTVIGDLFLLENYENLKN